MTDMKHWKLTAERWFTFTLAEQLGNVESEISRTLKWRTRNPEIAERAMARDGLGLDETLRKLYAPAWKRWMLVEPVDKKMVLQEIPGKAARIFGKK